MAARSAPSALNWAGVMTAWTATAPGPSGLMVDWAEGQFRDLGRRDAAELAVTLLAGVQGAALLANTFRDPALMTSQVRGLERWIDSLT